MAVKPVPDGFHTVTPYLLVDGVPKLLDFLERAFDGQVVERMTMPDGTVGHAQVKIGDSMVMMGQAQPQYPAMPCMLYLYVPDADATYRQALAAGGTSVREPVDEAYGDRVAGVADPCGNQWWMATHKEDLTSEEIAARMAARGGQSA